MRAVMSGRRRWVVVLVCLMGALAGCNAGEDPTIAPGETTDQSTSTSTTSVTAGTSTTKPDEAGPAGIDPLDGASTATVTAPARNQETALLTAVRASRHEGYDRVVFEFASELPGSRIGYIERPVRADGSGDEVQVTGAHVVEARFDNALDADLRQESAPRTYTGPFRFSPNTPVVAELVRTGGFEGVLTWVVGVRDRVDFRVITLASPPRVVIDFRNH